MPEAERKAWECAFKELAEKSKHAFPDAKVLKTASDGKGLMDKFNLVSLFGCGTHSFLDQGQLQH